jgi:disulfide bond formation protein DsbB
MVFTGSGECAKIEPILGLPMPFWTLLWLFCCPYWAIRATLQRAR